MYLAHRDAWDGLHFQPRHNRVTEDDKQVIIFGHKRDFHSVHMLKRLETSGVKAFLLEPDQFTRQCQLTWRSDQPLTPLVVDEHTIVPLNPIGSVFWRTFTNFEQSIQEGLTGSLLHEFLRNNRINWLNGVEAWQTYHAQAKQLSLAKQLGACIPRTILSNNAKHLMNFCQSFPTVLMSSAQSHLFSEVLQEELLEFKRLDCALDSSPISLQEYIPGTHIRSYVIGDKTFSAEMRSECLNPDNDKDVRILPLRLPQPLERLCRNLCRGLGMQWTAIDWRKDGLERYHFLGAHPSPEFFQYEQKTGYPITAEIMELLVS